MYFFYFETGLSRLFYLPSKIFNFAAIKRKKLLYYTYGGNFYLYIMYVYLRISLFFNPAAVFCCVLFSFFFLSLWKEEPILTLWIWAKFKFWDSPPPPFLPLPPSTISPSNKRPLVLRFPSERSEPLVVVAELNFLLYAIFRFQAMYKILGNLT